jgi:large subunit ribosomal protein L14e
MSALDVGRICIKTVGREAGRKCVIINIIDKSFVLITGPTALSRVKRRRVNISHIEPTEEKLEIGREASEEEVMAALEAAGKTDEMKIKV